MPDAGAHENEARTICIYEEIVIVHSSTMAPSNHPRMQGQQVRSAVREIDTRYIVGREFIVPFLFQVRPHYCSLVAC